MSGPNIYPYALGGMPIRGWELVEWLRATHSVAVLGERGLRTSDGSFAACDIAGDHVGACAASVSWRFSRLVKAVWTTTAAKWRARSLLAAAAPDLVYFNQTSGLPGPILAELAILGARTPWIARFGDRHGGAFLNAMASRSSGPAGRPRANAGR